MKKTNETITQAAKKAVDELNLEHQFDEDNINALLLYEIMKADYFEDKNKFLRLVKNPNDEKIYLRHKELREFKNVQNERLTESMGSDALREQRNQKHIPLLEKDELQKLKEIKQMLKNAESITDVLNWFQDNIESYFWMNSMINNESSVRFSRTKRNDPYSDEKEINFELLEFLDHSFVEDDSGEIERLESQYHDTVFTFGAQEGEFSISSLAVRDVFAMEMMKAYDWEQNNVDSHLLNSELSDRDFYGIMFSGRKTGNQSNTTDFSRKKIIEKVKNNEHFYENSWYYYLKEYPKSQRIAKMFDDMHFEGLKNEMLEEMDKIQRTNILTLNDYRTQYEIQMDAAWEKVAEKFPQLKEPQINNIETVEHASWNSSSEEKEKLYEQLVYNESLNIWEGIDKSNLEMPMGLKNMTSPRDIFLLRDKWDFQLIAAQDEMGMAGYNFLIEDNSEERREAALNEVKWLFAGASQYIEDKPYASQLRKELDERVFEWSKKNSYILCIDHGKKEMDEKSYDVIDRVMYDNDLVAYFDYPLEKYDRNNPKTVFMNNYSKAIKTFLTDVEDDENQSKYDKIKNTKPIVQKYFEEFINKNEDLEKADYDRKAQLRHDLIDIMVNQSELKNKRTSKMKNT